MSISLLIGAGLAALVGAGAHSSAKDTNREAEETLDEAKRIYIDAKKSLQETQRQTKESLEKLGNSKRDVLIGSMEQFVTIYGKIKNIDFRDSIGIQELSKFTIEEVDIIRIRELQNVTQAAIEGGAVGGALALALGGVSSLGVAGAGLSAAGTAFAIGEVGLAGGLAATALTPVAVVAAPVLLVSGISASMKADENLEKAKTSLCESRLAVEKMETSKVECYAIRDRSDMFCGLLGKLCNLFNQCVIRMDAVVISNTGLFRKSIDASKFTQEELKLLAVTGALAKAIKSVIDMPILTNEGGLSPEAKTFYKETQNSISSFESQVEEVKSYNYSDCALKKAKGRAEIIQQSIKDGTVYRPKGESAVLSVFLTFFTIMIGAISGYLIFTRLEYGLISSAIIGIVLSTIFTFLFLPINPNNKFVSFYRGLQKLLLISEFGYLIYFLIRDWTHLKHFWTIDIITMIVVLIVGVYASDQEGKVACLFKYVAMLTFFGTIAPIVFLITDGYFHLNFVWSLVIIYVLFGLCGLGTVYSDD